MDEHEPRDRDVRRCDVAIVGGGAAGLAAALQLARSRRSVVVVDAGEPRNAPAAHMHGYLGHDGRPPGDFIALARSEAASYGAEVVEGRATSLVVDPDGGGFRVGLADGAELAARRVLVATGLVDELPAIPGVAEQWGRGVLHCPYCHGWEVRDQPIAVIATGPRSAHQALLFRQLSDRVTVVEHGAFTLAAEDRLNLAARGVTIVDGRVESVVVEGEHVQGLRLGDGRFVDAGAVVVAPRFVARADLLRDIGIRPVAAPMGMGEMIETDAHGATSVAGVYAAGNVADVSHQVLQAAAEGSRVAAAINADLAEDDAARAVAALGGDRPEDWDRRYAAQERWWSGRPNGALVAEVEALAPGAALDVGCGEGADAIWLASRGWTVTAVDISEVALERARAAAASAGVDVEWACTDVAVDAPKHGMFDLVSVQYPALPHRPGDDAIRAVMGAVAPGGLLLVVGHDFAHGPHEHHHGFDPADYVQPADIAAHLDDEWTVEVHEARPRAAGHRGRDVPDVVLRARRTVQPPSEGPPP